ncbi:MAG: DUF1634 domain-containing protein [Desulfomicrobiaceae bacterium]|nr:DUF1634 domain-containing protein [Desulfomicrobiaceae bacterium]
MHTNTNAPKEQLVYADILFYGCWTGLALMGITYLLYVSGIMEPYVSMKLITQYWSMPVNEYLTANNVPTGWGWVSLLGKGDFLNFLGIALLAGLTIVGFVYLSIVYFKQKDFKFAIISLLEVLTLCLAASGIIGGGAH